MSSIALCIPAYNAAWCLPRLLQSTLSQEIPFDEILVYNDCSTDNTSEIAKQYGAKVIEGDINRGCSVGKNRLVEAAQSEWIHFHDADDELYPNFTTLAHNWIQKANCPDVVLFNYEWRDNDTKELLMIRKFDALALERDPLKYAILEQINPFCGLYRRNKLLAVGGYDTEAEILFNEDVAFHIKLAINNLTFSSESEISIVNYRVGGSMSSSNQLKCIRAHYAVLCKTAKQVGGRYPEEIAKKLWIAAGKATSLNDFTTADRCVHTAMKLTCSNKEVGLNPAFRFLTLINPYLAIRLREYMIRSFKPYLREK